MRACVHMMVVSRHPHSLGRESTFDFPKGTNADGLLEDVLANARFRLAGAKVIGGRHLFEERRRKEQSDTYSQYKCARESETS